MIMIVRNFLFVAIVFIVCSCGAKKKSVRNEMKYVSIEEKVSEDSIRVLSSVVMESITRGDIELHYTKEESKEGDVKVIENLHLRKRVETLQVREEEEDVFATQYAEERMDSVATKMEFKECSREGVFEIPTLLGCIIIALGVCAFILMKVFRKDG